MELIVKDPFVQVDKNLWVNIVPVQRKSDKQYFKAFICYAKSNERDWFETVNIY